MCPRIDDQADAVDRSLPPPGAALGSCSLQTIVARLFRIPRPSFSPALDTARPLLPLLLPLLSSCST